MENAGAKNPEYVMIPYLNTAVVDHFYEKLVKLNESSGLSLVFNLREAVLDLHCFYQEVMKRGGFYQVTKVGKWADVAAASNLKSSVSMSAAQLQNIYEILLLQYELMYCRKMPAEANLWPDKASQGFLCPGVSPTYSKGKRKWRNNDDTSQVATGPETMHKKSSMVSTLNSNVKEFIMDHDAPLKPRTGYHIFLRLETHRLKMIHGESSSSQNLREMAIDAWKCLPEKEKQPYMEASEMDKKRYDKEMATYKQLQDNQNAGKTDDVYHVSLETDSEEIVSPDKSMIELAIEVMRNAESNDPIFQSDWDNASFDMP